MFLYVMLSPLMSTHTSSKCANFDGRSPDTHDDITELSVRILRAAWNDRSDRPNNLFHQASFALEHHHLTKFQLHKLEPAWMSVSESGVREVC